MPGRKGTERERREQMLRGAYSVASRRGIHALTVRAVAKAAGLSHGLVHFHFRTKADLLDALLEWSLARTTALEFAPEVGGIQTPLLRLKAVVQQEIRKVGKDPAAIRLFFDFWLTGTTDSRIRIRMHAELERYRAAFRPLAEEVLLSDPDRFGDLTADGLVSVAVGFIKGCALQSVVDPAGFSVTLFGNAADALLGDANSI